MSVTVHLYPFNKLPNIGLAHAHEIPESQYLEYADAIHLTEKDQGILQAMYIWIQTYFLSTEGTPMAPSAYTSYSELWWLTKLYEKLRVILTTFDARGYQPNCLLHCQLYDKAMQDLGVCKAIQDLGLSRYLHFASITHDPDFRTKLAQIAHVLSLNAEVSQHIHNFSSRR